MRFIQLLAICTALFGPFSVSACKSDWEKAKDGYEVNPSAQASYLSAKLSADLGYSKLDRVWLQKAWVNGFQDHTYLFLITPDSTVLADSITKAAGPMPISGSHFRDGGYLGPSSAPSWWDTRAIDSAASRYLRNESRLWRFTWMNDQLYIVLLES